MFVEKNILIHATWIQQAVSENTCDNTAEKELHRLEASRLVHPVLRELMILTDMFILGDIKDKKVKK